MTTDDRLRNARNSSAERVRLPWRAADSKAAGAFKSGSECLREGIIQNAFGLMTYPFSSRSNHRKFNVGSVIRAVMNLNRRHHRLSLVVILSTRLHISFKV